MDAVEGKTADWVYWGSMTLVILYGFLILENPIDAIVAAALIAILRELNRLTNTVSLRSIAILSDEEFEERFGDVLDESDENPG